MFAAVWLHIKLGQLLGNGKGVDVSQARPRSAEFLEELFFFILKVAEIIQTNN